MNKKKIINILIILLFIVLFIGYTWHSSNWNNNMYDKFDNSKDNQYIEICNEKYNKNYCYEIIANYIIANKYSKNENRPN